MPLTGGEIALFALLAAGLAGFAAVMTRRTFASTRAHEERIAANNADYALFAKERDLECVIAPPYKHPMLGILSQFAVVRGVVGGGHTLELRVGSDDGEYQTELVLTIDQAENWLPGRVDLRRPPLPNEDPSDAQVFARCFEGASPESPPALRESLLQLATTSLRIETHGPFLRVTPISADRTPYGLVNGDPLRAWVDAALKVAAARTPATYR